MPEFIPDLEITALIHGGRGLGRHDGKAVFVPLTAPGDRVTCRITRSKKNYAEAELVDVKAPAAARRCAPCPYFGSCGGCQWQHLQYAEQLRWKEQIFTDHLVRKGIAEKRIIKPLVAAPDEWHYRNRVQFKCHLAADGLIMGFFRSGSHIVVDVDRCMLLSPRIQDVYDRLRDELPACPSAETVSQVDVAVGDDGAVRVVLHVRPESQENMRDWLKAFACRHELNACLQFGNKRTVSVVSGKGDLSVKVDEPELLLKYGPGGFVQVNSAQNRAMVSAMVGLLELDGTERVLDLFCGMGNFSLPLAQRVAHVVGVEDYAPSIASARENASVNQIDNAEFHAADAFELMARYEGTDEIDLVVLDPPRTGHYEVARALLKLRPERILYVSCDPATLARDLSPLINDGYEVVSAQPFDLFPQTWHIESMTLLRRLVAGD